MICFASAFGGVILPYVLSEIEQTPPLRPAALWHVLVYHICNGVVQIDSPVAAKHTHTHTQTLVAQEGPTDKLYGTGGTKICRNS